MRDNLIFNVNFKIPFSTSDHSSIEFNLAFVSSFNNVLNPNISRGLSSFG